MTLAPLWGVLCVLLLSMAWLLPNHVEPWTSFHSDALVAWMLVCVGGIALLRSSGSISVHGLAIFVGGLALIPLLQWVGGMLPFAGQAWIASAYLSGCFFAMLIGQIAQVWKPVASANVLFGAIAFGSVASVGMQLQQWFWLVDAGSLDIWLASTQGRPTANMGQPNQLATLHLWGLIAIGWFYWRGSIHAATALLVAACIVLGLALTQSRTGALGLTSLCVATWIWRRRMPSPRLPAFVTSLGALYLLLLGSIPSWGHTLLLTASGASVVDRLQGELRPALWQMLLHAAMQHPWLGWGVNQSLEAQLGVAEQFRALHHPFFSAHNLLIDLVLWVGLPLGLLTCLVILRWLMTVARRIRSPNQILYFMMVVTVGIHSLLEFPLQYAYFLLPLGFAMGALNADLGVWRLRNVAWSRPALVTVAAAIAVLLGVISRDYLNVEAAYTSLRLERADIVGVQPYKLPEVVVLTQLREAQRLSRYEPQMGISPQPIAWALDVLAVSPSPRNFLTVAVMFGLDNRHAEAQLWLRRMCRVVTRDQCALGPKRWKAAQQKYPKLQSVPWPDLTERVAQTVH